MTVFYVYLIFYRDNYPGDSGFNRTLLTCESRYAADEFFRALELVQHDGQRRFRVLERTTPQMWRYANDEGWASIIKVLRTADFAKFATRIMSTLLWDDGGRDWPIIETVDGPDWVNGGQYFIRNKRQPELYWFYCGGYVQISERRKTRFRIRGKDFTAGDKKVLIRSDKIKISLSQNFEQTDAYLNTDSTGNRLSISSCSGEWTFGKFIHGFGTVFQDEVDAEFVTSVNEGDGDEWELC